MKLDIDTIFEYLSWNQSEKKQRKGMALANGIRHLSVLIMPIENKAVWENCAKILASKSDEELEIYLFELFEWLKDMNWPGAYLIYDRLACINSKTFSFAYQYSLSLAKQTQDVVWEQALQELLDRRTKRGKALS